jgi:hypothetical protein
VQAWEPFAAAAVAPVVVWVLWRIQTVGVDGLRRVLLVLTRRWDTNAVYAVVSWFGTFLHEVSHATVLLLSGHGIREFRAGVEEGHVLPGRMRGGAGTLFFLAAALAPLYVPPLLALLAIYLVLHAAPIPFTVGGEGIDGVWPALRPVLLDLPKDLALLVAGIDLADWRQLLVLAAVLLGTPASRPSHVKTRFHAKGDGGDVPALRRHIRQHPLPFLLFVALLYGAYFAAKWLPEVYWFPLEAVWAVAIAGLVFVALSAVVWGLLGLATRTWLAVAWLGPAAFAAVEVGGRALHWPLTTLQLNGAALAAWLAAGLLLAAVLPRRR